MLILGSMNSVRQILEIDKILSKISWFIKTKKGQNILEKLDVFPNEELCKTELKKTYDLGIIINKLSDLPICSHIDVLEEINKAKKGTVLDEETFNLIKEELLSIKDVIKYIHKIEEKPESLLEEFNGLVFDDQLHDKIVRVITSENKVANNASPKLNDLRNKIEKTEREIKQTITKLLGVYKDQVNGDNFVLRDGVYVLPVSTSYKAGVDGIIHDISDSGQTTFIEPSAIVNLENKKHVYEIEEREEVTRILKELTYLVLSKENILIKNNSIIGYLDFLNAKIKFEKSIDGTIPIILKNQEIHLIQARHPLLGENVVANDFDLSGDKTLMLISGPNAGGKTIALKTVATLAYMTKLGLPIPASEGSGVSFFRKIYVDIGDGQSIENNLSTFSAHISVLSVLLNYISSRDLVIIDELGNGTDPKEGEALSMAIVEYLIERKCISLITSHYPLLKEYGLHNKNVLSASFIFNEERIEPTFRIVYDISGKSFGFLIAEKFGLKRNLIDRAKDIYNENYVDDNDRKIEIIENKERALFNKNIEIDNKMRELQRFEAEIKKRDDALNLKEEKLKNKKIDDFDDFVNSKIDEIDEIVEEFKKSNKENAKAIIEKINSINIEKKEKEPIFVGDYVEIKSLNMEGKVVSINNNRVEIVTKAGMTLKASKDACVKLSGPSKVKPKIANIDKMVYGKESLSTSINLIGYHVDEALRSLDKYLSDCYSRGYKSVRVIHGYGTGKLRQGIHNHLKTISYVKDFNLGTSVDGGTGLTVVNFK